LPGVYRRLIVSVGSGALQESEGFGLTLSTFQSMRVPPEEPNAIQKEKCRNTRNVLR